jgi:WD40 repeat protein
LLLLHTIRYAPWELVHDLAWSPDERWLAVAAGERVYLYDGETYEPRHELAVGTWASELAFSPEPIDGRSMLALAGRDGALQFWDLDAGTRWLSFQAHNKGANSLSFSPDGRWLASAGNDAILRLWETSALSIDGEINPVAEMIGGAAAVPAVRFSPQNPAQPSGLVVSVDLQAIRIRDPETSRLVRTLRGDASIFALVFSPDGSVLAAAEENASLRLWDPSSGDEIDALKAPDADSEAFLWDAAFHPSGSLLAAVDSAGQVFVWSFPQGDLLAAFQGHMRGAAAVAFSPDATRLATGGLDGVVYLWQIP